MKQSQLGGSTSMIDVPPSITLPAVCSAASGFDLHVDRVSARLGYPLVQFRNATFDILYQNAPLVGAEIPSHLPALDVSERLQKLIPIMPAAFRWLSNAPHASR
jgi:hypothetical protein